MSAGGGVPRETSVVIFISLCLFLGSVFRTINRKYQYGYTPYLLLSGLGLSYLMEHLWFEKGYQAINNADKHGFLTMFVPILLFEPALSSNYHYFKYCFWQIVILALPVLLIQTFLDAWVFKFLVGDDAVGWTGALTLGVLVSITDPVETITVLNQQGASHKFTTVFELESIMNDGTGIILFNFFSQLALKENNPDLD
jgi:NhaP-type Na+/H+ or K+/H+ antiporter